MVMYAVVKRSRRRSSFIIVVYIVGLTVQLTEVLIAPAPASRSAATAE